MYRSIKSQFKALSHKYSLVNDTYLALNNFKRLLLKGVNDETFAKIIYKEATGKNLNLETPTTFNEKLWWLKFNYRHPLMTQCSDKVRVRDYIKDIGLEHILTEIEGVYSKAEDIPFSSLEGKFFIKCNHVSGTNAVYDSNNPQQFNYPKFKEEFNNALSKNYYYQSREWNYKNIEPKIIVERFIEAESDLLDYRFFCFNGEVKLIFVDIETASKDGKHNPNAKRNIYNRDFILQDFTVGRKNFSSDLVQKPTNLNTMIEVAETIAKPFPFCRIDLYNLDGDIKFGEVTFYPGGSTQQFSSEEVDRMVASWLELPFS